ncbi:dTDP-4-dehydrorhamnose 3,5-epimerase [Terrabacter sp. LjRoot27]|uniref:dTDP-4-dehydrorhamnose 3,5-epimerase n=1 Tax=Terrabacter sp. LjRoot27 TaxID=3342306 RepID=UPI003ECCECD6
MRVDNTALHGVFVLTPEPLRDERGFFTRTFDIESMQRVGVDSAGFRQDSLSRSRRGVVRGLHLRAGDGEAKLVRCSSGAIFDVVLDLRDGSATFGRWQSFELDGETQRSVYIPAGCAHGFQALSEPADTFYRIDRDHDPAADVAIAHDDPSLGIPWPLPVMLQSDRDRGAPTLAELGIALPTRRRP